MNNRFLMIKPSVLNIIYLGLTILTISAHVAIYNAIVTGTSNKLVTIIYFSIFLTYIIATTLFIFISKLNTNQQAYIIIEKEKNKQMLVYTSNIEELIKNLQKQNHDYGNILLSLAGHFESGDFQETSNYFFNKILPEHKKYDLSKDAYLYLNYIKEPSLKGLLAAKIATSIDKGINFKLCIYDSIDDISMDSYDLCRVIGNLLDNAIESSINSINKKIIFSVLDIDNIIDLSISNTYSIKPDLNLIFNEGFSTNGKNRGLGLANIEDTLKKYENVTLSTSIEKDLFTQELCIYDTISNHNEIYMVTNKKAVGSN